MTKFESRAFVAFGTTNSHILEVRRKQLVTTRFCSITVQREEASESKLTPKIVILDPIDPDDGTTMATRAMRAPYDPYCFLVSFRDDHEKDAPATTSPNWNPPFEFRSHSGGFGTFKRLSPAIPGP